MEGIEIPTDALVREKGQKDTSSLEAAFLVEYQRNGFRAKAAYLTVRPKCTPGSANVASSRILARPHVKEYLKKLQDKQLEKVEAEEGLTKKVLIGHTQFALDHARKTFEIPTLLKGVEVGAKLIGAFNQDEDDMAKYEGLIGKIRADNVQVNINVGEKT